MQETTLIVFGFLGAILGSFTTLLVHRLHFDEKGVILGRSKCRNCHKTLKAQNLIPIFSWVFQKGKCSCGSRISFFYPLTEITFVITFVIFAQKFFGTPEFFPMIGALLFSLALFFYDVKFLEVDRRIVFPGILFALVWGFFRDIPLTELLIGGIAGFSFYAVQYFGSGGKWVGSGDMELGLFMGLVLGWKFLIIALFLSYLLGLLVATPLLITHKANRRTTLPMGAFLMPVTILFLYNGEALWKWYMNFIGL